MTNKPTIEVHIKITKEANDFMTILKQEQGINRQSFINKAIQDKINLIKKDK